MEAMITTIAACTALLLAVPPLPQHAPAATRELFPFDPVILIGTGERLEGAEARESVYGNYRYRFATEASQRAFDAVPSRFAIAFGGGCGRMGPLSGAGDVKRFEVVDEHIYLFASDACRDSFMQAPHAFMEVTEPSFPTDGRGLELATAARRWLRADAACAREIVVSAARTEKSGDAEYRVREEVRLAPGLLFTDFSAWNDDSWWTVAAFGDTETRSASDAKPTTGEQPKADPRRAIARAKRSSVTPEQPLDDAQFAAFRRAAMLEPLFLSRVLLLSDVKLAGGGAAEWQVGAQTLSGEILRIHWRDVTVEWLVKPATGQPVAQRAMRRARDMRYALVIEAFSEWNDRAGVRVPMVRTDGTRTRRLDAVESDCNPPPNEGPTVRAE